MNSNVTLFLYFLCFYVLVKGNQDLYIKLNEKQLDPELCERQLEYIFSDPWLLIEFINSGPRLPKNLLSKNPFNLGNYQKCLDIDVLNENYDIDIKGKYCSISLHYNQSTTILERPNLFHDIFNTSQESVKRLEKLKLMQQEVVSVIDMSRKIDKTITPGDTEVSLAVCIPKQCPTEQALSSLFVNLTALGLPYTENFYRFKNDKPWVTIDYVAITIFAVIIVLAIASTSYDLWHTLKLKSDPGSMNSVFRSFSVYTNGRRLLAAPSGSDVLHCVDGIRALSMLWIILLHSYTNGSMLLDSDELHNWVRSLSSIWVTSGKIAVDTFFMLSGMLLVYTAAKKMTSMQLLRNLHLFYLHRYLRLFPILATTLLLQTSLLHHVNDGPLWDRESIQVNGCRKKWWLILLFVQNYVHSTFKCLGHTWYLAIDMQLHILSPLVLFWVLSGKKRVAWVALSIALLACLIGANVKNFIDHIPPLNTISHRKPEKLSSIISDTRKTRIVESAYFIKYYTNTLTRAPPFLVGMCVGYVLHLYRQKKVQWSKVMVLLMWVAALLVYIIVIAVNRRSDDMSTTAFCFINSYSRFAWAIALGWMIFACVKGYGGPINFLLSMKMWKLPSRLSYGIYVLHIPLSYVISASEKEIPSFSVMLLMKIFFNIAVISYALTFIVTLLVEIPFAILTDKLLFNSGKKTSTQHLGNDTKSKSSNMAPETVTAGNPQKERTVEISEL